MTDHLIGFDIGGTFTDLVLLDRSSGEIDVHKLLTTPDDPARGAVNGIVELLGRNSLRIQDVASIIHGTTLVTNALLERRGAKTGMITTAGFRDILEMGKEQRYDIYDLFLKFPPPLVPRRWRRGIAERMDRSGNVITPLDLDEARSEIAELVNEGVESVAIFFLHSYADSRHEQTLASLMREEFPKVSISLSSEVAAEIREFERVSTTAANAYVKPLVNRYLLNLEEQLRQTGFSGRFYLMQSSGGTISPELAREFPIRLLESGPAGGALAAAYQGQLSGKPELLSFDMGGTTAKACVISEGVPLVAPVQEAARLHRFKKGSGIPIKSPSVDLIEIGAGGGSIARASELGLLNVGPESAGASPGPACYGLGGVEPTVTDANVVMGYLNPDYFLGGRIQLDADAAEEALKRVAIPLGLSVIELAWGIYTLVNENMANAARVHIVERGNDPRNFSLIAFGGAGPVHAVQVARLLGAPDVILPVAAGAASAVGFLIAPISFDYSRSYPATLGELDWNRLNKLYADLERQGIERLKADGFPEEKITIERSADMRLSGQFHEISVPVPNGALSAEDLPTLQAAFINEYERLYSHVYEGAPVAALTWRVKLTGPTPPVHLTGGEAGKGAEARAGTKNEDALKGYRRCYFPDLGGYVETPIFDRYQLLPGDTISGPAIFEERESTAVIGPGDSVHVDGLLNLRISVGSSGVRQ